MSAFSGLIKKAHNVFNGIREENSYILGRDGDVIFSKNNVCVHETSPNMDDESVHCPGYLTVHCQCDDTIGLTLILQWLPNVTLHKNPASIRSVSPRERNEYSISSSPPDRKKILHEAFNESPPVKQVQRPTSLIAPSKSSSVECNALDIPKIQVIPHTPLQPDKNCDKAPHLPHNGAESEENDEAGFQKILDSAFMFDKTPEQFAIEHDLMIVDSSKNEDENEHRGRKTKNGNTSLFSVNLGKMRSMRLFYSNSECTSGQLVIATLDSHYKILHFHHGGLDKLASIFEKWTAIKAKSVLDGSPSAIPDKQMIICQPSMTKLERDPEEGLYERLNAHSLKSYVNKIGAVDDSATIRKHIFFASMDAEMRQKLWPFLLNVCSWNSTIEEREKQKIVLEEDYQKIKEARVEMENSGNARWAAIENSILKDVVRTDRKNPFFYGDNNANITVMKNILMNYAVAYPEVNYIQGMSDLLAPLLSTLRNEVDAYWCFRSFMQQTVFSSTPQGNENLMEMNLNYLRNMLKLFVPRFYEHIKKQKSDALHLMFVHRWILLWFKREFSEKHALHIWECCWAHYRTNYFHLFVCAAIVSIYGDDVITQDLPHDEILLYFAALANHMDASIVLQKARGLLYDFTRLEQIPCALKGLCCSEDEQWKSHKSFQNIYCDEDHENYESCPHR